MADYHTPTVIQPSIPLSAMTLLEIALLTRVFDSEPDGDGLYFYADEGAADLIVIPAEELRHALAESDGVDSEAADFVREHCPDLATTEEDEIDLDISAISWEWLFQSVVKRNPDIGQIVATAAFTCTKMCPDGFGGMVILITADAVLGKNTNDMLEDLIAQAEAQRAGETPGSGIHVLLRFTEADVRSTLGEVLECDPDFASVKESDVTDADIRLGCERVVASRDLAEERGDAIFAAALNALRLALERSARAT